MIIKYLRTLSMGRRVVMHCGRVAISDLLLVLGHDFVSQYKIKRNVQYKSKLFFVLFQCDEHFSGESVSGRFIGDGHLHAHTAQQGHHPRLVLRRNCLQDRQLYPRLF